MKEITPVAFDQSMAIVVKLTSNLIRTKTKADKLEVFTEMR